MEQRLGRIDQIVDYRTGIVSSDGVSLVKVIKYSVVNGISATFYITPEIAQEINTWYWTPERMIELEVREVQSQERDSMRAISGYDDIILLSNHTPCQKCGNVYGPLEFIKQGIAEHGKAAIDAVMALKNAVLLRVNPSDSSTCPECGERITKGGDLIEGRIIGGIEVPHHYGGRGGYAGCCRGGSLQV